MRKIHGNRVLVAGLVHETHTFLAQSTDVTGFEALVWVRGQQMLDRCRGDASPMGGALEVAATSGWQVIPSRYGAAMPSGTVEDDLLEGWWEEVRADLDGALAGGGLDGVLLILHGAMVVASYPDGEGEVLRRVRQHLRERLGEPGERVPIAAEALDRAAQANPLDPPLDAVMRQVLAAAQRGPIGLIEPSDNIGGGTPGDGTGILDALLCFEVGNAAVILNDPEAAAACHSHSRGDRLALPMGGKVDRLHGDTITLEVVLENLTDGRFDLENERSHLASLVGRHVDMGPSAVVRCGGIHILLTTHKTPPMDLGQLRSQGMVPEELYMIGIKVAVSHKAAYDPILAASFYVDTPGLGSSDLRRFPYRHLRRPMRPLDD